MISISERLRARCEPVGDGKGTWRKDGLCQEAADTIDALVAVLEDVGETDSAEFNIRVRSALAKAKGKQE